MTTTATAANVLDREFLELRAALLQIAAQLDRLDRADGSVADDPRLQGIRWALEMLAAPNTSARAEQVQMIFSRHYDTNWKQQLST